MLKKLKKIIQRSVIGVIILFPILFLIACGVKDSKTIIKTEMEPILPPKKWMEPIKHPKLMGNKNRDLWILLEKQNKTLDKYKIRIKKLREWRKEQLEKKKE